MVLLAMRSTSTPTPTPFTFRRLLAVGLAAALLAACGNDDDTATSATPAGDSPNGAVNETADQPVPEVLGCTFEPNPDNDDVLVGYATVRAENTTDQVIDTTLINFTIPDVTDASRVSISYWQPGETIEMEAGIFSEDGSADLEPVDCENVEVNPASYGDTTDFDAAAATCEITVDEDALIMSTAAQVDVSAVSDLPDGEQVFVTLAIRDGDTRIGEQFPYIEPGETTAAVDLFTYEGDDLGCEVMNLRLP
jgi:hypothetical protein